ncbi:MAG: hypothetical protein ACI36Y_00890 [Coriobacteriales bacterium]
MKQMERIALCVDDTDDLTKDTSTGKVAELIAGRVAGLGGQVELGITRHQLLLDESVPYTSHNSSMAFTAWVPQGCCEELWQQAAEVVRAEMSAAADPGLCLAVLPQDADDPLLYELIDYGRRAKAEYVSKAQAYELAERIPWLRLEELGGDGQGVVGALAGVGLRLSGSDGRFRGKWDLQAVCDGAGVAGGRRGDGSGGGRGRGRGDGSGGGKHREKEASAAAGAAGVSSGVLDAAAPSTATAARVCEALGAQVNGRVAVLDAQCNALTASQPVATSAEAKPLLFAGCMAIVAQLGDDGIARPCDKDALGGLESGCFDDDARSCPVFEFDNDQEEYGATGEVRACPNCLYRRWTAGGFTCMRQTGARSFSEVVG